MTSTRAPMVYGPRMPLALLRSPSGDAMAPVVPPCADPGPPERIVS